MVTIDGIELTKDHIGKPILYSPSFGKPEIGLLSSYREDGSIFVKFKAPNGERCNPEYLHWSFEGDS